jgi:hypothetical protein
MAVCAIISLGPNSIALAQNSVGEFQKILRDKATFNEVDFAALAKGEPVVRLLPVNDKKEVAAFGLVGLQIPAELFLKSFRQSMTQKSNPAILEIGKFSGTPSLDDFETLTIEDRDIEDLKECVVGDCKLKLSATMIERLQNEVDWQAADYRFQATRLLKLLLLDYVRDYLARGDAALIEYSDKPKGVRLADEQRELLAASSYLGDDLSKLQRQLKDSHGSGISVVENSVVWSKIKFGLKPVITFNHIMIYKREQEFGPQIIVASKQIYANHYFDSSLALTAFVTVPNAPSGSYLIYENRSRADGLQGAFGKLKRGIVEGKAVNSLKAILESSKANLNKHTLQGNKFAWLPVEESGWRRWTNSRAQVVLWLFVITVFATFFGLRNYNWRGISGGARH